MMSGHANATVRPYIKGRIHKTDGDRCWWLGEETTDPSPLYRVHDLVPQIRRLWRDIGKAWGWKRPRPPLVK